MTTSARVFREDIVGPVAPITALDTDDEGIDVANDTEHGLVSYAFTRDLSRAITVAKRLETGMVGLNRAVVSNPAAPFGGVKSSGLGREGGTKGVDEDLDQRRRYRGVIRSPVQGGAVRWDTPPPRFVPRSPMLP